MDLKELFKSNHFSKEEYRSAFIKKLINQELNIRESTIFNQTDKTADIVLPTEFNDRVIKSVSNYNKVLSNLKNLFNIENHNIDFELPIASVVDDENEIGYIKVGQSLIKNIVSIPELVSLNEAESSYKFIFDLLTDKTSKDIEDLVFNADGTNPVLKGLPVAGSGENGAYVADVDLISTAALTETNLISLIKMINGNPRAKFYMNESTFLDNVFPLMSTSELISQNAEGTYLIGTREVIFSDKVVDDVVYLADLSFLVGNIKYRFAKKTEFREAMQSFGLFALLGLNPVTSKKGFAKLVITA